MLENISALIKSSTPKVAFAAFVATGSALFAPQEVIANLGLDKAVDSYREILGLAFIASGSLSVTNLGHALSKPLIRNFRHRRNKKIIRDTLDLLTFEERAALFPYIKMGRNTLHFEIANGVSNGLIAKNILYRASNIPSSGYGMYFAVNLQPMARSILVAHGNEFFADIEAYIQGDQSKLRQIVDFTIE